LKLFNEKITLEETLIRENMAAKMQQRMPVPGMAQPMPAYAGNTKAPFSPNKASDGVSTDDSSVASDPSRKTSMDQQDPNPFIAKP
jgi:hypothetical protein